MPVETNIGGAANPKRRRPRAIQACNFCRSKKYKCDGNLPCIHCHKHGLDCVFRKPEGHDPEASAYSISYVKRLERRLELAEARLKQEQNEATDSRSLPQGSGIRGAQCKSDGHVEVTQTGVFASPLSDIGNVQQRQLPQQESQAGEDSDENTTEMVDINSDTNAIEFHGNTSSLAFLGLVCEEYGSSPGSARNAHERRESLTNSPSLVMTFHNSAFRKEQSQLAPTPGDNVDEFYPRQAHMFLDTYFQNLHYIHPIIDHADFLRRCEDMWNGHANRQPRSFIALYYSTLSLGALIRTWTEKQINGMGRFEWSRKLYQKAEDALIRPGAFNDIHAVQALFILAKVCQNEMNPNLAYTYLGMAVRSALSVGLNRNSGPGQRDKTTRSECSVESKVWWGIYSLEVEMSFALGRPDTTGMDAYHNREMPPIEDTEFAIIPIMLPLCRIMRNISTNFYLTKEDLATKIAKAIKLEDEIDAWHANLPPKMRSGPHHDIVSSGPLSSEIWPKLQSLVLRLRHLNVKMILLRPFLLQAAKRGQTEQLHEDLGAAVKRCAVAAAETIDIIYATFSNHVFFRTWWYNATYTMFAASIMLFCAAQTSFASVIEVDPLLSSEKALEILDAMAEGMVANNVANFLRPIVERLRTRNARPPLSSVPFSGSAASDPPYLGVPGFDPSTWIGAMSDIDFFPTGISFIDGGLWDFDMNFEDTAQYDSGTL